MKFFLSLIQMMRWIIYKIPRKNHFMGRWIRRGGWYPDYRQPQLFRKNTLTYVPDVVHENYHCHSNKPMGYLKNPIWQIPFEDLSEMMQKANRYSTLGVDRLKKNMGKIWESFYVSSHRPHELDFYQSLYCQVRFFRWLARTCDRDGTQLRRILPVC